MLSVDNFSALVASVFIIRSELFRLILKAETFADLCNTNQESVVCDMSRRAEQIRGCVVTLTRAGLKIGQISEIAKIPKSTVSKIALQYSKFLESGEDPDNFDVRAQPKKRRSDVVPRAKVNKLRAKIASNPSKSYGKLGKEVGLHRTTVAKIVKNDLGMKSYVRRRCQILSAENKARRLARARILLNRLKAPEARTDGAQKLIFYSDEKNFQQDQAHNKRNDRWIATERAEVPGIARTKFPAQVMVLGVISNEGDVMPPYFFEQGLKVNTDVYLNVLNTVVKPWMETIAGGRAYTWQQDGAPAHTSARAQDWCAQNFPAFWEKSVWPPSSPDLNPMDFFFWSVVESDANQKAHNTIQSLKAGIKRAFAQIDREAVKRACASFRGRLERCIEAEGDYFE